MDKLANGPRRTAGHDASVLLLFLNLEGLVDANPGVATLDSDLEGSMADNLARFDVGDIPFRGEGSGKPFEAGCFEGDLVVADDGLDDGIALGDAVVLVGVLEQARFNIDRIAFVQLPSDAMSLDRVSVLGYRHCARPVESFSVLRPIFVNKSKVQFR